MRKWTTLMVAGALSWTGLAGGQTPPPLEPPPAAVPLAPPAPEPPPLDPKDPVVPVNKTDVPPPPSEYPTPPPAPYTPPPLPIDGPGPVPIPRPPADDVKAPPLLPPGVKDSTLPPPTAYPKKITHPLDISDMPNVKHPPTPGPYYPAQMPPGVAAPIPPPPMPPYPCRDEECTVGPSGLILTGDAFWLRPRRSDPVAILNRGNETEFNAIGINNDTHFGFGFRAGVGYLDESGFFVTGTFTYFDHRVANNLIVPADGQFAAYFEPGGFFSEAGFGEQLRTSWDFQFQSVDIMSGAVFCPGDAVEIHLGIGAKLAWIDQTYQGLISEVGSPTPTRSSFYSLDLHGAGPRFGGECRFYMPGMDWLAVYARGYATLLLGHRTEEGLFFTNGSVRGTIVRHDNSVYPVLEIASGVDCSLIGGRLIVGAGYEFNYWFGLGETTVGQSTSDISLDGVFIRVTVLW